METKLVVDLGEMYNEVGEIMNSSTRPMEDLLLYMEAEQKSVLNRIKTLLVITKEFKDNPVIKLNRIKLVKKYNCLKNEL